MMVRIVVPYEAEHEFATWPLFAIENLPAVVCKSLDDSHDYMLQTRRGTIIRYQYAEITGEDFVTLYVSQTIWPWLEPFDFTRRVEVRISEIDTAWEADS